MFGVLFRQNLRGKSGSTRERGLGGRSVFVDRVEDPRRGGSDADLGADAGRPRRRRQNLGHEGQVVAGDQS